MTECRWRWGWWLTGWCLLGLLFGLAVWGQDAMQIVNGSKWLH